MAPAPKKEKILLIESDAAFGQLVVKALQDEGYASTTIVSNAAEGIKAIYDGLPHLVLLDITLADGDGYEVLQKKQAEPLLQKIPVFLISTQGVPINMRSVPAGSVLEYLTSLHIEPKEIVEKVDRHFGYEAVSAENAAAVSEGPKKKILWVEDDKLIGTILAKKLVSSGFDLFHAKNGDEALEALKSSIPDVIVLDLLLPGMTGFDILQKVKEDERLKKIPSMILSNLSKPSDIERARTLGANKFLVKAAASLDQIVSEIKQLCG